MKTAITKRIINPWCCQYCGLIVDVKDAQKTWTLWRDRRDGLIGAILACCPDEMCQNAAQGEHTNFNTETATP